MTGRVQKMRRRRQGRPAAVLLDEAAHLLRLAPLSTHIWYLAGTAPFVLGLLYFWADMTRSAYAHRYSGAAALGVALLFTWMKTAQSVYCARLLAQASGARPPRFGARGLARLWIEQTMIQPWGIPVLALSASMTVPLPWAYAFFQNVTVLGGGERREGEGLLSRAWRQATLWPGQLINTLTFLSLFGFFVLVNLALAIFLAPQMIKIFFGIESVFTSSGFNMLNTTFLAALMGLAYVCFDPYVKAAFVLRCYYGESLKSGEDLRAELRDVASAQTWRQAALVLAAVLCLIPAGLRAQPDESAAAPMPAAAHYVVSSAGLDEALRSVIQERKYSWRMPREALDEDLAEEELARSFGPIGQFIVWTRDLMRDTTKAIFRSLEKALDWIEKLFRPRRTQTMPGVDFNFVAAAMKALVWVIIAALIIVILWLLVRVAMEFLRQFRAAPEVESDAVPALPDVADESVSADQLPEDEWLAMARDLWERGEHRLALRALYLGCLAALARRELLQIARHKSNREYERELRRRAHALPELPDVFAAVMTAFERVWYGRHEAPPDAFARFVQCYERIAADAPR